MVGSSIARHGTTSTRWTHRGRADSSIALAVSQITRREGQAFLVSGADFRPYRKGLLANTIHWTYDTWMLANWNGQRHR